MPTKLDGSQISILERETFWSQVLRGGPDECWVWRGRVGKRGGPSCDVSGHAYAAKIVSWVLAGKRDPTPDYLKSTCGNRMCVNPAHLYADRQAPPAPATPLESVERIAGSLLHEIGANSHVPFQELRESIIEGLEEILTLCHPAPAAAASDLPTVPPDEAAIIAKWPHLAVVGDIRNGRS